MDVGPSAIERNRELWALVNEGFTDADGRTGLGAFLDRRNLPGATPVVLAAAPAVPVQLLVDLCDTLHARSLTGIDIRALEAR